MNARERRLARRKAEREALKKGIDSLGETVLAAVPPEQRDAAQSALTELEDTLLPAESPERAALALVTAALDEEPVLAAAASGSTSLPLSDRDAPWDAGAAKKTLGEGQYGSAHFWRDPDGDPKTLAAYKLPFAKADGTLTAVWRGVTAAAGAISGARGGVSIPEADVGGVKSRINSYYAKARKKYGDDDITAPWEMSAEAALAILAKLGYVPVEGASADDYDEVACAATALAYAECGSDLDTFDAANDRWLVALLDGEPSPERLALYRARMSLGESAIPTPERQALAAVEEALTPRETVEVEFDLSPPEAFTFAITPESVDDWIGGVTMNGEPIEPDGPLAQTIRLGFQDFTIEVPTADVEIPYADPAALDIVAADPAITPPAAPISADGYRWTASFAPEGVLTDDYRAIAPGALTWRELPLTLMAMIETTQEGHDGALVAGRIDRIWRDANGMVRGEGVFDADGEFGAEVARMVDDKTLRGVSIDMAIHSYETGPRSDFFAEDGTWAPSEQPADGEEPSLLDLLFAEEPDEPVVFVITDAVIGAVTVCPFPAFADTKIEMAASLVAASTPATAPLLWTATQQGGFTVVPFQAPNPPVGEELGQAFIDGLTAAAAGLAPDRPPAAWFTDPGFEELTPLNVDDSGRVFGHAWAWDTCHIGIPGVCTTAPYSNTGYAHYLLKEVETDDGGRVAVGTVTLDTGHADKKLGVAAATAHYDDTGTAVADVAFGEDEFGGWFAGALRPDVDAEKARAFRGAVLSGDWRNVDGNLELVALLAVNVPGFPVPRTRALVSDGEVVAMTAAGILVDPALIPEGVTDADLARIGALRDQAAGAFADLAARVRA